MNKIEQTKRLSKSYIQLKDPHNIQYSYEHMTP